MDRHIKTMVEKHIKKSGRTIVKKSDHKLIVCNFSQKGPKYFDKKEKIEFFNFKDDAGWRKYKQLTSRTTLTDCFKGGVFEEEARIWFKKFKNIIYRCFSRKRHVTFSSSVNEVHSLMLFK